MHTAPAADPAATAGVSAPAPLPLPTIKAVSQDSAGSSIVGAQYHSVALHGTGSFLAYLPVGYDSTTSHYPVLYLLTGNEQSNMAFLQIGLQGELDRLIARHAIPPLIAVMIQGGPGTNNWRNNGGMRYESYILEVQELIDRSLPTIASRDARAVAGDSMGGYGAMNVALANPYRFGVVESWLSFFNGLDDDLRADRPVIARLGLHAFVYGGQAITSPIPPRTRRSRLRCAPPERMPGAPCIRANTTSAPWKPISPASSCSPARPCVNRLAMLADMHPRRHRQAAVGALGAASLGAIALGAVAGGAGAIGALAIGRLAIRRAAIRSLDIGELRVQRLTVGEPTVERELFSSRAERP